jgi:vancomycin resistance protein YoaR
VALLLVLVLGAVAVGERVTNSGNVMPGVAVHGVSLSGSDQTARDKLRVLAAELEHRPVRARAGSEQFRLDPTTIDYQLDVDATLDAADGAGRSMNPLDAVAGTVLRRFRDDEVAIAVHWDEAKLAQVLDEWGHELSQGLQDGGLRFEGATVTEVAPVAGVGLRRTAAERRVERVLRAGEDTVVRLPVGDARPPVGSDEVARAAGEARRLLADPVVLTVNGAPLTIEPAQLGSALTATPQGRKLVLGVDVARLREALAPALGAFEQAPVDASFTVNGGVPTIVPSQNGHLVDLAAAVPAILRGERSIPTGLVDQPAGRTTEQLQALNITEQVSTFTTNHPCCAERVKNIHRACDIVNGTLVEPGQTFSLNDTLGPRTPERGFVKAPAFATGEGFYDDYGGGVSQFSTTLFNATFFGGYKDVGHTPHSIYISRYPMGREATLDYPGIDNKFQNDTNAGVLVTCGYTDTAITVTYYGNTEGRSVTAEGPNVLEEIPVTTEYVDNPLLPPGVEQPISTESGYTGYRVENYRIIHRPGQPDQRETYKWSYDMRPRKIYRGSAGAPPTTAPAAPTPPG